MSEPVPVPFGSTAYKHKSLPISAQNLINLYGEIQRGDAKGQLTLHPTPGLLYFTVAGSGPIRGLHNFDETLVAVSGGDLYSIDIAGTATLLGTGILGSGYTPMAFNGAGELAIATGATGGWVWNGTSLTKITDSDFQGVNTCRFQHQRIIWDGAGGNFQLSELNDAGNYTTINIADAEALPDDTVAIATKGDECWLFGRDSVELWSDRGGSGFPYERSPGAVMHTGIGAVHSIAIYKNTIYWLGHDFQFYGASDLNAQPIGTPALSRWVKKLTGKDDCEARVYTHEGQTFVDWTFRQAQRTICFGIDTGLWHEKSFYNTDYTDNKAAHRGRGHASVYDKNFVGDFENGNIYILDGDTYTDNGTMIRREATSPPMYANGKSIFFNGFQLFYETGRGLLTGQGSAPLGYLTWSDDDGRTFGADISRDLGARGKWKTRLDWKESLGMTEESRVYRYWTTEPIPGAIVAAFSDHDIAYG